MPQMNPIWWLTLMIMFLAILLFSNSLNYFYKVYKNEFKKNNYLQKPSINWKW
nr:ATP synthase F0 subunit 8 [Anomopsocus sp. AnspLA]